MNFYAFCIGPKTFRSIYVEAGAHEKLREELMAVCKKDPKITIYFVDPAIEGPWPKLSMEFLSP